MSNKAANCIFNARRIDFAKVCAILALAVLGGCTQAPTTNKSGFLGAVHQASLPANSRRIVDVHRQPEKNAAEPKSGTATGLASFYEEGSNTASGEKFDPNELTAAHPTLPFGTRLRVTNMSNGRSVVVRVNDRGPFVPGRSVDVTPSAAEGLGMIGRGTAKVKIDVVQ